MSPCRPPYTMETYESWQSDLLRRDEGSERFSPPVMLLIWGVIGGFCLLAWVSVVHFALRWLLS